MRKLKLKKVKSRYTLLILMILTTTVIVYAVNFMLRPVTTDKTSLKYIASSNVSVPLYDKDFKQVSQIYRGTKVATYSNQINDEKGNNYLRISYEKHFFYIDINNLTDDKQNIIKEEKIYVRTPATIYKNIDTGEILSLGKKGEELHVIGYDVVDENGEVNSYKIKVGDKEGYIYRKYVLFDKVKSLEHYEPSKYYDIHNTRGNRYGGGHAGNLDYYPVIKPKFEDNIMPEKVYALYLNGGSNTIGNIDAFIDYAKATKINAFVVDIKDSGSPGYKSKVYEQLSPTNFKYANNSFEKYKNAITKLKEAGFYVIGRISVFKDRYYCLDNPNNAILNTKTKKPYLHDNTYWPSPYQRSVWEFNVNLAKEAVIEMGFNEIQFDYVRFPDRTGPAERNGTMDFRNYYGEEKAQAIQRFMMYAVDEIHKLNAYVSIDVFGESAYTYVTAYGQYWASLSNIVDVISGMPYPDHFNKYDFGFKEPVWTMPYELVNLWGSKYVMARQKEIPTPAILRTWIQVSDVPSYKHPGGYAYGVSQIDAQIRGLFDAGLTDGYMTWLSSSNLERYKSQKDVYNKEY